MRYGPDVPRRGRCLPNACVFAFGLPEPRAFCVFSTKENPPMTMNLQQHRTLQWALTALAGAALVACGGDDSDPGPANRLPVGVTQISSMLYSATVAGSGATAAEQDLLTGGIGKTGLGAAVPTYANPASPTADELRRNALYANYRGILDPTVGGGYGTLYGPNVSKTGAVTASEGLIPGREYVAVLDDGSGRKRTVVAVQVPDSFNPASPCVVLGASSGSRGVYGAIGTAGEWGLKNGCAVALTDAGKGVGLYCRGQVFSDSPIGDFCKFSDFPRTAARTEQGSCSPAWNAV